MMDFAVQLQALRRYVFDYATGVLWLSVLGVMFGSVPRALAVASAASIVARTAQPAYIPDVAANVLLAVIAIALPYSIGVAVTPITDVITMGLVHRLRNRLKKRWIDDERYSIVERSQEILKTHLGIGFHLPFGTKLMFIERTNPKMAAQLRARLDDDYFQETMILPVSILIGRIVYRLLPDDVLSTVLSVAIALAVFATTVWYASDRAYWWAMQVEAAVIFSATAPAQHQEVATPATAETANAG